MRRRDWFYLAGLTMAFGDLNLFKPLHIDDAAYFAYADQIARRPLDPYGFAIFWYQSPQPAFDVLAPPVVPYYWSVAIAWFGESPVAWKAWFLPFAALFVMGVYALCRRFCAPFALAITTLTVLSPAFLPSFNLMLDVPAMSLGLCAIAAFALAVDRGSLFFTCAAGVLAGLAMQTKYTALLVPATFVLFAMASAFFNHGDTKRFPRLPLALAVPTIAIAFAIFASWEWWIARRYGESHFLAELRRGQGDFLFQAANRLAALPALLGGVGSGFGLVALTSLRPGRNLLVAGIAFVAAALTLVALVGKLTAPAAWLHPENYAVTWGDGIFFTLGWVVLFLLALASWKLLRPGGVWSRQRHDHLLVVWLALELVGYAVLSPFAAVRRVLGLVVVGGLISGRLAARRCGATRERALVHAAVLFNMLVGIGFYGVDFQEASVQRQAVIAASRWARDNHPGGRIYFTGHWGFQHYASEAGWTPANPDDPAMSLAAGDLLIVPPPEFEQQRIRLEDPGLQLVKVLEFDDPLPFRTVRCFYGSVSGASLERKHGPRFTCAIYLATRPVRPDRPTAG